MAKEIKGLVAERALDNEAGVNAALQTVNQIEEARKARSNTTSGVKSRQTASLLII